MIRPKPKTEGTTSNYPDYYDNPPEGFVAMWRLVESLRDGSPLEPEAAALSTYWRENGLWPDYPPEYYQTLDELIHSDDPEAYVTSLQGDNSDVLLRWLGGYIEKNQWIGGRLQLETIRHTWNLNEDDDWEKVERCRVAVNHEQVRRTVPPYVWEGLERLRQKHWGVYPEDGNWGGFKELAFFVRRLYSEEQTIAKYEDRPQVVAKKVAEVVEGKRRVWQSQREDADAEAVRDRSLSHNERAEYLERDAKLAEFIYLLYRDYLEGRFKTGQPAGPSTTTQPDVDPYHVILEYFIARPDGVGMGMEQYEELAHIAVGKRGEPIKVGTLKGFYSSWKKGDTWITQELIDKIISKLEDEGRPVDHTYIRLIKVD